jgi:hypothetical protein
MKRPSTLKILGKRFRVQYVSGEPLSEDETGECDSEKQLISVKEGQELEAEQDTVIHEILHALEDLLELKLEHDNIVRLTTGLHALVKENPRLFTYLRRSSARP